MNRFIPIKIQYIFMCIPFFNCMVLFMWLFNYSRLATKGTVFAKSLFVIFASTIPIVIIQIILQNIFQNVSIIFLLDKLMLYLIPFSMAFNLIRFQKKVLKFN